MGAAPDNPAMATHRPLSRSAAQQLGDAGERFVERQLRALGWDVLARNVHVGRSEIDLIAVDPGPPASLVLVEVQWRGERDFGLPEETVDWRKRRNLRRARARLLEAGRLPDGSALPALPVRIDLVAVEPAAARGGETRLRHHRAAVGG